MKRIFATKWGKILAVVLLIVAVALPVTLTQIEGGGGGSGGSAFHNEELVTLTDDSMVVTWVTDEPGDTGILYGTSRDELTNCASGETIEGIYHYMELTGLTPGTKYYYRVCSDDAQGSLRSFTTLTPPGDYLFSFATMNDTHIGRSEDGSILAEQCVTEINERGVSFTIIKGDLTEHGLWTEFQEAKKIYDGLDMPYYPVMGNHDIWPFPPDADEPIGDQYLLGIFEDVLPVHPEGRTYYSFDYDGYRFICMDSVSREKAPFGYAGAKPTGEISSWSGDEEFNCLRDELADNTDKIITIYMHHPSTEDAEDSVIFYPFYWFTLSGGDAATLRGIIGDYDNVVGVFSGHTHRNEVTYAPETGNLPYAETGATVEYPCGYNIYKVYTNGYIQSFYKCQRLDLSEVVERSQTEHDYRFGNSGDRNFAYTYNQP